ncbi:OmpA/MotB family protein [Thalassoroseus pseudoceratinae]|uniref:OmpA/MotB family protein n=1 Tax=Thalassoroseus pseudoceratinae TaxID=2713176 RepID=UPI00141D86E4|nr:flagellar motor protein MotB [Thalassoroseus pseudoceratinae]
MAAEEDDAPGVPEWVVTYGDMMSLLLTFFIMLVSLSELKSDNGEVRAALDALRESFGNTDGRASMPGRSLQSTSEFSKRGSKGNTSEGGIKQAGRDSTGNAGEHTSGERINHGNHLTLGGPVFFDRFSTTLSARMKQNLSAIAEDLIEHNGLIVVRGHTTREPLPVDGIHRSGNEPIQPVLTDKMDLAFARATVVANFLIAEGVGRKKMRISAAGDTETHLLTREANRQDQNRRVDVFTIASYRNAENSQPDESEN